jgi:hypothetical protein
MKVYLNIHFLERKKIIIGEVWATTKNTQMAPEARLLLLI